jgi:hypothetical protein
MQPYQNMPIYQGQFNEYLNCHFADVFLHNVDGNSSRRDSPRELLCGEELRFLNPSQIDEVFLNEYNPCIFIIPF